MAEKIKVVVADDVVQTRTDIKRLLYFEEDMEIVAEAGNGKEAIEVVGKYQPDVVLMDINMPVMDGITATETITINYPQVSVVIISIQGEQEYLKKAMVAGARDYLVKPLSSEEMATTIRQAYHSGRSRNKMLSSDEGKAPKKVDSPQECKHKIISFFCGKGGIGKTTLASNLAVVLAQKKIKVALVDLDLQFGDVAVQFNLNDTRTIGDLVSEEGEISEELLDSFLIRHISGVHILSAPLWPQEAEKIKIGHIEKICRNLKKTFDCIIFDTPPSFNDISLFILEQCDLVLIPVRRDISTIKNVKASLDILNSLQYGDKVQIILNHSNLDFGIDLAELERGLDYKVAHTVTGDEKTVVMSINKGIPFTQENTGSEIAKDLQELGDKVLRGFDYRIKSSLKKTSIGKLFSFSF